MADNWDRIQSLFLETADLPPEEQARFLDTACADDADLRSELDSLLASDRRNGEAISAAVEGEAALLLENQALIGSRLGAYRVIKELGHGGMGAVYLAERDDGEYRKQVAIKVVKRGMDTVDVLERFRHERQILANLEHPYIARLLDGGATFDGRPFFVMEFVEGQPLDDYCDEHKLDIKARCRLFLGICEAVSHAHRNLVVHRDLKPGNIFVTPDGTPKLLDFGVAKLLSADPEVASTLTVAARPFTAEYASPEQVRGLPVSTATDIYSLGAVLYELLTGERAQQITSRTPVEVERVVCKAEVGRPSLIAPGIDSDLDNIVLMAMRKEAERRYPSVDRFADDIRRYLTGLPVTARQDSFSYRTGKFLRRNQLKIAVAGLVFSSLIIGLVAALSQWQRAEAARSVADSQRVAAENERSLAEVEARVAEAARADEARQHEIAETQRARAEQRLTELIQLADRTLFDIHSAIEALPGAMQARRAIVKTTLDYLESLEKDAGADDRMRLVLGAAYTKIAAIQGDPYTPSLGDFAGARASYQKAEALLQPLQKRDKDDPDFILRWLEVEAGLAEMTARSGEPAQAVERFSALLPAAHKLAQLRPSDKDSVKQEAELHQRLAVVLQARDTQQSLVHSKQHVAILSRLVEKFPGDSDLREDLAAGYSTTAGSLKNVGDLTTSMDYFERSIRIRQELIEQQPANVVLRRGLMVVYGNYATLLGMPWSVNLGRFAEAREYCAKAVAIARDLVKADPQNATARYDLAMSLARFGMVEPQPDQMAESLRSLQEAIGIVDPIFKANPKSASMATQVALAREYAGHRLEGLGQTGAAVEQYRESLALMEALLAADAAAQSATVQALADEEALASLYADKGDRAQALDYAARALARASKATVPSAEADRRNQNLAHAYFVLATVRRTLGDRDESRQAAERAVSLWRSITTPAFVESHRKSLEEAEKLIREDLAQKEK